MGLSMPSTVILYRHMGIMCTEIMLDRLTECDTWPESPANQNKCLWMLKHICISLKAQTNDCWPDWGQGFKHAQSTAVDTHLFTHAKCSLPLQTRAVHSQICKQTHTHNPVHSSNGNKRQTHNSIQRSPALAVAPIHTPIESHTPSPRFSADCDDGLCLGG